MKIKQYEHYCTSAYTLSRKGERRMCWALLDDKGDFIDSFDYDTVNNKIRFYGNHKHYNYNDIPENKQKLWKTNNLGKIMFHEIDFKGE